MFRIHIPKRFREEVAANVKIITKVVVTFLCLKFFIIEGYEIQGNSMEATFKNHEKLLVDKLTPRFLSVDRGDVIIFQHSKNGDRRFVKRVVAVPGDVLEQRAGKIYVNDILLEDTYTPNADSKEVVPEGKYYVLGDNRAVSHDSRYFDYVSAEDIIGKALFRFWPLNRIAAHFPLADDELEKTRGSD